MVVFTHCITLAWIFIWAALIARTELFFFIYNGVYNLQMIYKNENHLIKRRWCVITRIGVYTDQGRPSFRRKTLTLTCVRIWYTRSVVWTRKMACVLMISIKISNKVNFVNCVSYLFLLIRLIFNRWLCQI